MQAETSRLRPSFPSRSGTAPNAGHDNPQKGCSRSNVIRADTFRPCATKGYRNRWRSFYGLARLGPDFTDVLNGTASRDPGKRKPRRWANSSWSVGTRAVTAAFDDIDRSRTSAPSSSALDGIVSGRTPDDDQSIAQSSVPVTKGRAREVCIGKRTGPSRGNDLRFNCPGGNRLQSSATAGSSRSRAAVSFRAKSAPSRPLPSLTLGSYGGVHSSSRPRLGQSAPRGKRTRSGVTLGSARNAADREPVPGGSRARQLHGQLLKRTSPGFGQQLHRPDFAQVSVVELKLRFQPIPLELIR